MEQLKGYLIGTLPITGLNKVQDLIEYEGPILSHFVDLKNDNYFFYWVDNDTTYNRWLIWKISDKQLYRYLKGNRSLKELMEEKNKDFLFSVDIDLEINYTNIHAIELTDIPAAYVVEETSNYKYSIPPYYTGLIDSYESNYYLTRLRELALYYKLSPTDSRFSTTVAAIDAAVFLKKLNSSFLNFIEEDFFNRFKMEITDISRLQRLIKQFKEVLSPRIVELEYGSFKIGLGANTFLKAGDNTSYENWQENILEKYKQEVVDVNYNSKEELQIIAEKYDEEARKKIFAPYLEILNDKDFSLEVSNYNKTFKKRYTKVSNVNADILFPKHYLDELVNEKRILYNVVIEVKEGQDVTHMSKKAIQDGMLFSKEITDVELSFDKIKFENSTLLLNKPLSYTFRIHDGQYYAENFNFRISVSSSSKEFTINEFQRQFAVNYFNLISDKSEENKELKTAYLDLVNIVKNSPFEDLPF